MSKTKAKMNLVYVMLVLLLAICGSTSALWLTRTGLQDLCTSWDSSIIYAKDTWTTESAGVLVPRLVGPYTNNLDCTVVIQPPTQRSGLVVSVRELDLRPNNMDSLTITYNDFFVQIKRFVNNHYSTKERIVDKYESKSYYSQGNITIRFTTGYSMFTAGFNGFQLTYTTVSNPPCGSYEFRCTSSRCISRDLQCDGRNHCGDGSDQLFCDDESYVFRPIGSILGGIFGSILLVIAVACGVVVISRSFRKTRRTRRSTLYPPPHSDYPQQLYPPVGTQYPPPPTYDQTFPELQGNGIVNPSYR